MVCWSILQCHAADEKPRIFKPAVTRTQLRVAKSLNPEDMQELNVKSNNGGFATILVKKRDGKSTNIPPQAEVFKFPDDKGKVQNDTYVPVTKLERVDQWQPIQSRSQFAFPTTRSPYRFAEPNNQQSLDLINSFMKHVEQIDTRRETNSRSINLDTAESLQNDRSPVNIAVASTTVPQNDAPQLKVPPPVFISSVPVYVKGENVKRGRSVMSFDSDGIPVVHGVREPDDEQDKKTTWRNARVINGELVPYEKGYKPPKAEPSLDYGQLVYVKSDKSKDNTGNGFGPFTKNDNFADENEQESVGPFSVEDNLRRELGDAERYDNGFGPFTIYDNAKVANSKLIGYIKKINEKERRRDYFAGRSSRNYDGYNIHDYQEPPQMQRRMLQHPGNTIYSTSMLYTPTQNKASEKFVDGTRTPVLEYVRVFYIDFILSFIFLLILILIHCQLQAHPELGVQPAKAVPADTQSRQKFTKIQYYAKNSNFPYTNDPALVTSEYYPNDGSNSDKPFYDQYSFKNTHTYPYNYGYLRKVKEQPFYLRFAEQMRDSFQNGFTTVHDLTRPVIGPLMEAGHKISKNLGFSKGDEAQDKVGVVATSSNLMPAIGLVAGLGLGAMAVGRIFEGNMLRRSNSDDLLDADNQRAIDAVTNGDNVYVVMEQENGNKDESKRLRRSIDDFSLFSENAGAQLIRVKRRGQLSDASYKNDKYDDHPDVIDVIDERDDYTNSPSIDEILQLARLTDQADDNALEEAHSRSKRNVDNSWNKDDVDTLLQDIEQDLPSTSKYGFEEQIRKTDWSNTPCAKKVFCEVMLQQSSDDMVLMEKKIDTLLSM